MEKEFTLQDLITAYSVICQVSNKHFSEDLRERVFDIRVKYKRAIRKYEDLRDLARKEAMSERLTELSQKEQRTEAEETELKELKAEFEKTMQTFVSNKLKADSGIPAEKLTPEQYKEIKRSIQPDPYEMIDALGRHTRVDPADAVEEIDRYFID